MSTTKYFLIKELAQQTGLSSDTIRFYEKKKLLKPSFRVQTIIIVTMMKKRSNGWFLLNVVVTSTFPSMKLKAC